MARINLLPWREWERKRKQREFFTSLGVVFALGAGLIVAGMLYLDGRVDDQKARNAFLTERISELDTKIAEIRDLQQIREDLLARMRVIQELQGNRPVIVRVFDEMVRTLSSGVHYDKLQLQGAQLSLTGLAESNNRISALMRNIDGSDWFANPNLKSIKEDPKNSIYGPQSSTFSLTFDQINPNAIGTEE